MEKLNKSPEGDPYAAHYYAVTASIRSKLGQPDAAVAAIRRARDLDSSNPETWEFLISELLQTNRLTPALFEAIRAQKRFPDEPSIQLLFGLASYQLGDLQLTNVALRNLSEVENDDSPRLSMLKGMVDYLQGRNQRALQEFTQAAQNGITGSKLLLALALKESGKVADAERQLREAESLYPNNGQIQFELAKLLLLRGDTAQALIRLQKAEKYLPREPMVHYHLAILYRKLGQPEKSGEYLQKYERLKKEVEAARAESPFPVTR